MDGELGNNLLFTYKTRALTGHVEELARVAEPAVLQVIKESDVDQPEAPSFVRDAIAYQVCRMSNIFKNRDIVPSVRLEFDIQAYEQGADEAPVGDFRLQGPTTYEFFQTDEQSDLLERYFKVFGDTDFGIGRMMTKIYVKRLLRAARRCEAT